MQKLVKINRSTCEEGEEHVNHYQIELNADHIGTNIEQLKPGDHIAWERSYLIWHHAIVVITNNNVLTVIHFSRTVHRADIKNTKCENSRLFRINYPEHVIAENPPCVVLDRANQKIKQNKNYNLFSNNCEHLATYCKTGEPSSYQVKFALQKGVEVVCVSTIFTSREAYTALAKNVSQLVPTKATKQVGQQLAASSQIGQHISVTPQVGQQLAAPPHVVYQPAAKGQVGQQLAGNTQASHDASKIAKVSKLVNIIGTVVAIVAEVWFIGKDIYKFAQQRDSWQISASHANQLITERIGESVIGGVTSHYGCLLGAKTGAILGTKIGSLAGPVGMAIGAIAGSVVGTFFGSFASSSIGKCFGSMVGRFLGRLCWW